MRHKILPAAGFSAIDSKFDIRTQLVRKFNYAPKRIALRRLSFLEEQTIHNGKRELPASAAMKLLEYCSPFGVRTVEAEDKRNCRLIYWCPHCWIRRRVKPIYVRTADVLLNEQGSAHNTRWGLVTVERVHHEERCEVPVDSVWRNGQEFYHWATYFANAMDQYRDLDLYGAALCCSFRVSIGKSTMSRRNQGRSVYCVTPVTSLLGIVARQRLDDLLESVNEPSTFYDTRTSAAPVVDSISLAHQTAIAARYPVSWASVAHWPILPDCMEAIASQRMFSTYGCLRRDLGEQLTALDSEAAPKLDRKKTLRVSVQNPNSRFLPKSPAIGSTDDDPGQDA